MGDAGFNGEGEGLGVHPGEHENGAVFGIGGDAGHQPVLVKARGEDGTCLLYTSGY